MPSVKKTRMYIHAKRSIPLLEAIKVLMESDRGNCYEHSLDDDKENFGCNKCPLLNHENDLKQDCPFGKSRVLIEGALFNAKEYVKKFEAK